MLRKLVIAVAIVIVSGGIAFWLLTIPQTVPAGALGSHQPDLANGRTMFIAGGCSGCHAVPGEDDKTRLAGGLRRVIEVALGAVGAEAIGHPVSRYPSTAGGSPAGA